MGRKDGTSRMGPCNQNTSAKHGNDSNIKIGLHVLTWNVTFLTFLRTSHGSSEYADSSEGHVSDELLQLNNILQSVLRN